MAHNVSDVPSQSHRESLSEARDEQSRIATILQTIKENMINPFTCPDREELINIATGEMAETTDLIYAKEKVISVLREAEAKNAIKIIHPKLSTFRKKKTTKSKQIISMQILKGESSVVRALYFTQNISSSARKMAFTHEWAQYPSSLFEPDVRLTQGYAMRTGCMREFLNRLFADGSELLARYLILPQTQSDSPSPVYPVDAMSFI